MLPAVARPPVASPSRRAARRDTPDAAAPPPGPGHGTVALDADRAHQVLANLLDNARRHTPVGGQVTLTAHVDEGIAVTVTDTGEGIDVEHLPHVFERFYRDDASRGSGHQPTSRGSAGRRRGTQPADRSPVPACTGMPEVRLRSTVRPASVGPRRGRGDRDEWLAHAARPDVGRRGR